ncbi:MAG: tRNA pseudouridine(55) synthase TruB [Phycisphaerae bacterium]|jgi:tRNA pseudouridine55 synthase|nr:tRNA pseudouridine(55) synthase TruB [Phycisphaerae bacterium]
MFGLLNINKPVGPTSHDIVSRVRKIVGRRKGKVGHAGTLDPFADGVLVVCVGPATRLADYVQQQTKGYRAVITLGAVSDTHDITGQITENPHAAPVNVDEIHSILKTFVGRIAQIPPAHSALHVDGKRAYDLARAGHEFDLPAREVNVYQVSLVEYDYPSLTINVSCGAGTYIRSLARDIGEKLGVGAYCSGLTRTSIGNFDISRAINLDNLNPAADLIDPIKALDALSEIKVDSDDANRLAMGKMVRLSTARQDAIPEVAVTDLSGRLIAIAELVDTPNGPTLKPSKVFVQPER